MRPLYVKLWSVGLLVYNCRSFKEEEEEEEEEREDGENRGLADFHT